MGIDQDAEFGGMVYEFSQVIWAGPGPGPAQILNFCIINSKCIAPFIKNKVDNLFFICEFQIKFCS